MWRENLLTRGATDPLRLPSDPEGPLPGKKAMSCWPRGPVHLCLWAGLGHGLFPTPHSTAKPGLGSLVRLVEGQGRARRGTAQPRLLQGTSWLCRPSQGSTWEKYPLAQGGPSGFKRGRNYLSHRLKHLPPVLLRVLTFSPRSESSQTEWAVGMSISYRDTLHPGVVHGTKPQHCHPPSVCTSKSCNN